MLQWQSLQKESILKENRRYVIRNIRKFLDGALVGNVEVEAVGSAGVNITSGVNDADLVYVVTANQLAKHTPCIMLVATRGAEPPAKTILELFVTGGGGDGTPVVGSTGATGADSTVPGPASTVPVPDVNRAGTATGADSTRSRCRRVLTLLFPGPTGADSTVPGATGQSIAGAAGHSIVGSTGADSTVTGADRSIYRWRHRGGFNCSGCHGSIYRRCHGSIYRWRYGR